MHLNKAYAIAKEHFKFIDPRCDDVRALHYAYDNAAVPDVADGDRVACFVGQLVAYGDMGECFDHPMTQAGVNACFEASAAIRNTLRQELCDEVGFARRTNQVLLLAKGHEFFDDVEALREDIQRAMKNARTLKTALE